MTIDLLVITRAAIAVASMLAAGAAAAQTPNRDVQVNTVDWAGNIVRDVQICVGNGAPGEEALFFAGTTNVQGSVRFFNVPGGGTGRGVVVIHATKPCPPNVQPSGRINNVDVYDCGVGGNWFHPSRTPAGMLIEVEVAVGAASQQDALNAPPSCGTQPPSPYPASMRVRPSPLQLSVNQTGILSIRFTTARNTEALYNYRWEIDDRSIADFAPGSSTDQSVVELIGRSPGTTKVVGYRQNMALTGHAAEEASDSVEVIVAGGPPLPPPGQEPYTFGWERAVDQRAKDDFMLPHQCAVGQNLASLVQSRGTAMGGCSLRANADEGCATCHRPGGQPPDLRGVAKTQFCNMVPGFAGNAAKPQYLKDFFDDWYGRRDPATGECPD